WSPVFGGGVAGVGIRRLDHADQPVFADRVVEHRQIAFFEDIERQAPARQQQHADQRKDRQFTGQGPGRVIAAAHAAPTRVAAQENRIEDSLRRPPTVIGSFGPLASKYFTSCLRASSSFQARSRLMLSSRWSIASWCWPAA